MACKLFIQSVNPAPPARLTTPVPALRAATMGHPVLLIDDSAILRRIATTVLGGPSLRCEVLTATRVNEGFARACGTPPGLILADAHLAGTKAEWCQRLLAEPRTAGIPVVLLLGPGMPAPEVADLPDNVVATLAKPFTPEQLLACVTAILGTLKDGGGFTSIRQRLGGGGKERIILVDQHAATAIVAERPDKPRRPGQGVGLRAGVLGTRGEVEPTGGPVRPGAVWEGVGNGSLRSAFRTIAAGKGSGVLALTVAGQPLLDVYFDAGSVVVVTTGDVAAYSSGAAAVLPAKVSPATLEAAADEQRESGVPFLLALGARGLLPKAAAVDLLHQFGQRFFARVWQLRAASISGAFTALEALPAFTLRLEPRRESVDAWLLGTLRCVLPEDIAAKARHEGCVGTPRFLRDGQAALEALSLTDREREFSRRVNGKLDLPGIAKGMNCTAESAYLILHRFRALEIMDYRPAPVAFVVTPRTNVRRVLPLRP